MTSSNPSNRKLTPEQLRAHFLSKTYLDPLWDTSFKLLIADQAHPEQLVHFLNALLRLEGPKAIVTATLRGTEQEVLLGFERKVIFDIHCITQAGELVVVEFQRVGQSGFKDRMLYYSAAAIRNTVRSGERRYDFPQIYVLALMNFSFEDEPTQWRHTVELVDLACNKRFYPKLQFVYVSLPNFNLQKSQLHTPEEMWLYALKRMGDVKEMPKELKGPIFEDLFAAATISKFDEGAKEYHMSNLLDEAARNDELSYAFDKGEAIGLEKGQRKLDLAQIDTIQNMLDNGLSWDLIERVTHVGEQSYQTLRDKYSDYI